MKTRLLISVFLVLTLTMINRGNAGLGVSDLEVHIRIENGQSDWYEVADIANEPRLNTTAFNITVQVSWVPTNNDWTPQVNNSDLVVEVSFQKNLNVNNITLAPTQHSLVFAKIVSATPGIYHGLIQFKGTIQLPPNSTGNPTNPGGSAHVTFDVVNPVKQAYASYDFKPIIIFSLIGGVSATAILTFLHIRKNIRHKRKLPMLTLAIKTDKRTSRKEYMRNYMREKRRKQREAKSQS